MKRLIPILLLFVLSCEKPEETIYEPTEELICVDCFEQLTHMSFLDVFCGDNDEADRFIFEAKLAAKQKGLYLYCIKKAK